MLKLMGIRKYLQFYAENLSKSENHYLFVLMLYVPVIKFSVMSGHFPVFLVGASTTVNVPKFQALCSFCSQLNCWLSWNQQIACQNSKQGRH